MTDRDLFKQALEALEAAEHLYHHVGLVVRRQEIEGVITALRERLARPDIEVNSERMSQWVDAALGERLAREEAVPKWQGASFDSALHEPARREQEPVAWLMSNGTILNETTHPHMHTPLYTAPQPREWAGLTDAEIDSTFATKVWDATRSYARAIEAKLREKNA